MAVKINIVLFGIGNVGSALINKAIKNKKTLVEEKGVDLRFPVITNSTVAFFEQEGKPYAWEANFIQFAIPFKFEDVLEYVFSAGLENVIAIDATASPEVVQHYPALIGAGFNVLTVNSVLEKFPPGFVRQTEAEAIAGGVVFERIESGLPKDRAAVQLLENIIKIAEKNIRLAS